MPWVNESIPGKVVDTMPENDSQPHVYGADCKCGPRRDVLPNGTEHFIHHSFDGREVEEESAARAKKIGPN